MVEQTESRPLAAVLALCVALLGAAGCRVLERRATTSSAEGAAAPQREHAESAGLAPSAEDRSAASVEVAEDGRAASEPSKRRPRAWSRIVSAFVRSRGDLGARARGAGSSDARTEEAPPRPSRAHLDASRASGRVAAPWPAPRCVLALPPMRTAAVFVLSLSLFGCAAVFRGTTETVHIESAPEGAEATRGPRKLGATPTKMKVDRQGVTQLTVKKEGYEDHHGVVKKTMNPGWLAADIITCLPALCIPLLIDAFTGAWYDVDKRYVATMKPGLSSLTAVAAAPAAPEDTTAPGAPSAPLEMSESERKATARAAYIDGVALQEKGNCAEALARFEAAEKLYPAPTHLLRIGQCQAAMGKLVEASETYETLARTSIAKDASPAFREAQEDGKKALTRLKPRIPTLRIETSPRAASLSSVVVKVNGGAIPSEVLGLARPVNPGHYTVTVWAAGYKEASVALDVGEGAAKAVELRLDK